MFLPCFSMLIFSQSLSGLGSKSTFFALGSVYAGQDSAISIWISFLDSLFFLGVGQMELLYVAWFLQDQGNANWKACTRSQVKNDYFIIIP